MHDAGLGRRPGEQDPFALEVAQDDVQRRVVERRVAWLDDEPVSCLRCDRGDELSATALLDSLPHQARGVAVPDPFVVVGVDHWDAACASGPERGHETIVPFSKRGQQLLGVLVPKVVDDVDEEQRVSQRSVDSSRPERANE